MVRVFNLEIHSMGLVQLILGIMASIKRLVVIAEYTVCFNNNGIMKIL